MNKVITAIFDGETLHPETPLDLPTNQRYQIIITVMDKAEDSLTKSAELYAEIYQEDKDLQQLTESALIE